MKREVSSKPSLGLEKLAEQSDNPKRVTSIDVVLLLNSRGRYELFRSYNNGKLHLIRKD